MVRFLVGLVCMVPVASNALSREALKQVLSAPHPLGYNLGVTIIPNKHKDAPVMICCHGYGSGNSIGRAVSSAGVVADHIVSFNFYDHDFNPDTYDHHKSAFGSIKELLPLLYILKKIVIDAGLSSVNLYGFSAGGGVVVNTLAILNGTQYEKELLTIGIDTAARAKILDAIQAGLVILDCPLKSMAEIIDFRGKSPNLSILSKRYQANNMQPIDSVKLLRGLKLHILLDFQKGDQILSNRDDQLFIDRLREANSGTTDVIIGNDGGHNTMHTSLWREYKKTYSNT